jgi:hypothetical protein
MNKLFLFSKSLSFRFVLFWQNPNGRKVHRVINIHEMDPIAEVLNYLKSGLIEVKKVQVNTAFCI